MGAYIKNEKFRKVISSDRRTVRNFCRPNFFDFNVCGGIGNIIMFNTVRQINVLLMRLPDAINCCLETRHSDPMAYYITGLLTVRTGGLTGGEHRMI